MSRHRMAGPILFTVMSTTEKKKKSSGKTRKIIFILALVILIVGFRLVEKIGEDKEPGERFVVAKVVDGDTVELKGGDVQRLLAVDTPEKEQPYYEEARQFLIEKALGKKAEIVYGGKRRDRYGRLLGFLYIDSVFVNREILARGLGYLYLFRDNIELPQTEELLKAQKKAIDEKLGLWSRPYRAEDYYVSTPGSFRFHRPGCRSVANSDPDKMIRYESREEAAKNGLAPCRNCRP